MIKKILFNFPVCLFIFCLFFYSNKVLSKNKILVRKDIRLIAEQTEQAEYFYSLNEGAFINCIEQKVIRLDKNMEDDNYGCWKVEFRLGKICPYNDGDKLTLDIYIDCKGNVISSVPDIDILRDKYYCKLDEDCTRYQDESSEKCLNYFYASNKHKLSDYPCVCEINECIVKQY